MGMGKKMRTHLVCGLLLFTGVVQGAVSITQWTWRFKEARDYASALTGCYGTASYRYVIPTIETLTEDRNALLKSARENELEGFIWTISTAGDSEHRQVIDIKTGEVRKASIHGEDGIVLCQCREPLLKNCTPSNLPPLGQVFTIAPPPAVDPWTDPLTGLVWNYASPGKSWRKAKADCRKQGGRLPDLETLQVAQPRLKQSIVGAKLFQAGNLIWSATEATDVVPQAFAMFLDRGDARWVMQSQPLPFACVAGDVP